MQAERKAFLVHNVGPISLGLLVLGGLYLTSLYSYLLFHSLIELFSIVVAGGIFVIAWNARGYMGTSYLLFIGIASIFVAFIDLIHTLAYPGMGVFPGDTRNLSPQLWVAARFLRSVSWLVAPFLLTRRLRIGWQVAAYAVVTALLLLAIFYWKVFPAAYVAGIGLTPFKVNSEYIVCAMLLAAVGLLYHKRAEFDPTVLRLLIASLLITAAAELTFTSYVNFYSTATVVGHLLRLVAYFLLYKAIIETGLVKPYSILLRDLKVADDRLREHAATLESANVDLRQTQNHMRADADALESENVDLLWTQHQMRADAAALESENVDLRQTQNQMRVDAAALESENVDLLRTQALMREHAAALQARNDELDAFAHTVAHDLKNPLAVIVTTGDVINHVSDLSKDELKDYLKQMRATAFEMNSIVDSLLLLAEVRKVDAPVENLDMAQIVNNVCGRLDFMFKEHRGRLIQPRTWPTALGYAPWIEQVWTNYITNALKYGGPAPRVELGAMREPRAMIRFWTRDQGPGIPPEVRASLFTPFTQLPKIRKGGHGLGLSIVLRIVQKLGGEVGVESNDGAGSLFYFTLPAAA